MRRRRLSTIGYLTMAAALLNVADPCAPTQNVEMPTTTTTMGGLPCTTAMVPNTAIPPTGTTNPAVATAGPGQSVTLTCNVIVALGTLQIYGDNLADYAAALLCPGPCVTLPLTITCDGTTGRFTFVPTTGPDTGTSVAVGSIACP